MGQLLYYLFLILWKLPISNFCAEHNINNLPQELKYITKIAEHYRLHLKAEVLNQSLPKEIEQSQWTEACDVNTSISLNSWTTNRVKEDFHLLRYIDRK